MLSSLSNVAILQVRDQNGAMVSGSKKVADMFTTSVQI